PVDEPRAARRADCLRARHAVDRLDTDRARHHSESAGDPRADRARDAGAMSGRPREDRRCGGPVNRRLQVLRTLPRWLPGYGAARLRDRNRSTTSRVWVTFADHFEPWWRRADDGTALERVRRWARRWPFVAERHVDDAGRPPCYTFFYPQEQYH